MGFWIARSLLQRVDENTGRAGVMESKLIAATVSDNDLMPLDAAPSPSPSQASPNNSISRKLRELQDLRKDGVITEEEFQKKRQELLEKL